MFHDPKIEAHAVITPMKSASLTPTNVDAETMGRLNKYLAHIDAGYAAVEAQTFNRQKK